MVNFLIGFGIAVGIIVLVLYFILKDFFKGVDDVLKTFWNKF